MISRPFIIALLVILFFNNVVAQNPEFTMEKVGTDRFIQTPWDLEYGPDDKLWVTEREVGRVVRIDPNSGNKEILLTIPGTYSDSGQDGLLGMALHPNLLSTDPYVYLSYTYLKSGNRTQRIVRYTLENEKLMAPEILIDNLPASHDHNSGRLIFGPDNKLYYSIGDQGNNQNRNYCAPVLSQFLPSQEEIDQNNWTNYPGKILRLNLDGSIPEDNPSLDGVRSHIFSYGHRNPQGLVFGKNGQLYSDEHGPDTDDEVNAINSGFNYGWPRVVGFRDNQAYDYCNWSSLPNCSSISYTKSTCPEGAEFLEETTLQVENYSDPLYSLFAVTDDYNFNDPSCQNSWICRPNVAPSSLGIYESDVIPGWNNSLLVTSLKRGRVYRLKLNEEGTAVVGDTIEHFYTQNRYRDIAISPDGKSIFILTDQNGRVSGPTGLTVANGLHNPGNILKFTAQVTVSTDDNLTDEEYQVYPNPANNFILVKSIGHTNNAKAFQVFDLSGRLLINQPGRNNATEKIQVGQLQSGLYFLKIQTDSGQLTKRVIVQ